jgi:type I restriction enzyme, R subunit
VTILKIFALVANQQREFLELVLSKYIESSVDGPDDDRLPALLTLKYEALDDAMKIFGTAEKTRTTFISFQKHLYAKVGSN